MGDTSQQIRMMELLQQENDAYMRREIKRVVENARIQARGGNTYPYDMLCRIAAMPMPNGVTNYQKVLQSELKAQGGGQ